MKKQSTFLYVLRLALTLLAITSLMGLLLAGINALTKDPIAAAQAEKTQKAIEEVLPGGGEKLDAGAYKDETGLVSAVYAGEKGYAVEVTPMGFDNTVTMMVGVDAEGKVLGISVISHSETKGLGEVAAAQNAKGEAFREQFVGKDGPLSVKQDGGDIDAISGATITSRAVTEGVNAAIACVKSITG